VEPQQKSTLVHSLNSDISTCGTNVINFPKNCFVLLLFLKGKFFKLKHPGLTFAGPRLWLVHFWLYPIILGRTECHRHGDYDCFQRC